MKNRAIEVSEHIGEIKLLKCKRSAGPILASTLKSNESGNVESALVLIPLLILFLSVLQISASLMGRTIGANFAQSQISQASLYRNNQSVAAMHAPFSLVASHNSRIAIPGGGAVLTLSQVHKIPLLTPLMATNDKFSTTGIVIDENP